MAPMSSFLSQFIGNADGMTIVFLVIALGVFLLEDTTVVIVGVLAADGVLSIPFALASLYAGIVVGDIVLYSLGYLASTHARLARYMDRDFVTPFRIWLENRFVLTVFSARFIPGSRLPTYTASGFFRSPLSTFIITATAATAIWTTLLFTVAYWFGSISTGWFAHARWGIAAAFLIALFLVGRHNLLAYRAKRDFPSGTSDIKKV